MDSLNVQVQDYEGASWLKVWKKATILGLYIAIGTVTALKDVANGILDSCKAIVEGVDFITVKAAIPIAEKAVDDIGKAGDAAFTAAQAAL